MRTNFVVLLLAVVLALFIIDVAIFLWTLRVDEAARQRLRYLLGLPQTTSKYFSRFSAVGKQILDLIRAPQWLNRWVPEELMAWAGIPMEAKVFQKIWWLLITASAWVGVVVLFWTRGSPEGWFWAFNLFVITILAPPLWLSHRKRKRARYFQRDLPGFLELLALTVEAGLGFEPALRRVSATYPGPLGDELRRVIQLMSLGVPRSEALRQLAKRSPTPEVANFVEAVNLSEQLGTSLARTLQVQVKLLRTRRRQRAEALAQTAPLRIIPALVFFFLPALLLIYLAPPILLFFAQR
ncbi:MAG: hypothetical protein GXO35_06700 [Gammaproteobacteria bacterium]|nr:hypothetical protein [Gammaproteobacteria bacterium]